MKRFPSLKKNNEFDRVYQCGKSCANRNLVLYILKNEKNKNRIGISVSKKVGNSVVRHRMTRLVRECFRRNENQIQGSYDMIVIVRPSAKELDFWKMQESFLHVCRLQKVISKIDVEFQ